MSEIVAAAEARLWHIKARASAIHVAASGSIFLGLLSVVMLAWYPGALMDIDGGWRGLRIVFAVDVVLGPLLTFVVFNPAKPRAELVRDLSAIVVVQLAALAWGAWVVHSQRPVALVEWAGKFQSVQPDLLKA